MSRIRFEWDIESQRNLRSDAEDERAKRRRKRRAYGIIVFVCFLLAAVAAGLVFVERRLQAVETQFAQLLQDTVKAEVAALRIGDLKAFLSFQADEADWQQEQTENFDEYSQQKTSGGIELTGNILAVNIDGERARVLVQENVGELPYARLWFYQREGARWRHVAPSDANWGAQRQFNAPRLQVNYREADQLFAEELGETIASWLRIGCELFGCADDFAYTLEVQPDAAELVASVEGAADAARQLRLRSPYADDSARADGAFDISRQYRVSQLIAEAFIADYAGTNAYAVNSDAHFLRESAARWLAERFTRIDSGALLMRSLAGNYGDEAVARMLLLLPEGAGISSIRRAIADEIAAAALDWRDFFAWRLLLEGKLIAAGDEAQWLPLVDTRDEEARRRAYARFNAREAPPTYRVREQSLSTNAAGETQSRLTVEIAEDPAAAASAIHFTLVGDVWLRAD